MSVERFPFPCRRPWTVSFRCRCRGGIVAVAGGKVLPEAVAAASPWAADGNRDLTIMVAALIAGPVTDWSRALRVCSNHDLTITQLHII
ncbi:hypothetical protein [uncultured Kocuria sp.]|uniref:hypothetical protein n=1 Tax=uncultured Kocuria sp. TaxID=259305 RepID=UPI002595CA6A|nr:hypothetical protein [uncultured Kocuria sp.]